MRSEPDDRLVARVRGGDESAFEAVYDRYSRPLLSFCRHMLGDLQEAEDAVQQTFLSAHRALLADGRDIHLKAWLFAIARNRCLSVLRARREHVGLEDDLEPPSIAGLSAEVERREDLREMLDDLNRLPAEQREALLLAELGAHSHDEIAEVLDVRRDKVKALIFQAREGLGALRDARATPCADIREQLATARGGALRRAPLRRHLETCEGCREFRDEVARQRAALAVLLPVAPSFALKQAVLAATIGGGGGAAAAAGIAGSGAVAGAAGVSAAGVGAAGSLKAVLSKVLITSAVAAGAGGTAVVGVHEIDRSAPPKTIAIITADASPTSRDTPLPRSRHAAAASSSTTSTSPSRTSAPRHASAPRRTTRAHRRPAKSVQKSSDTTVLPAAQTTPAPQPAATPAPSNQQAAVMPAPQGPPAKSGKGDGKGTSAPSGKSDRVPPGQAKKQQQPAVAPTTTKAEGPKSPKLPKLPKPPKLHPPHPPHPARPARPSTPAKAPALPVRPPVLPTPPSAPPHPDGPGQADGQSQGQDRAHGRAQGNPRK